MDYFLNMIVSIQIVHRYKYIWMGVMSEICNVKILFYYFCWLLDLILKILSTNVGNQKSLFGLVFLLPLFWVIAMNLE